MITFNYVNASGNPVSVTRHGDMVFITVSEHHSKFRGVDSIRSTRRQVDAAARRLPAGYRVRFPAEDRGSHGLTTAVGYVASQTKVYRLAGS